MGFFEMNYVRYATTYPNIMNYENPHKPYINCTVVIYNVNLSQWSISFFQVIAYVSDTPSIGFVTTYIMSQFRLLVFFVFLMGICGF